MENDADKSKEQLIVELTELRKKAEEQEDNLRAANQQLKSNLRQTEILQQVISELNRSQSLKEIYTIAANGIIKIFQADSSSILLFDDDGKIHFKAWKNLSQNYRRSVAEHSPWKPQDIDAQPLWFSDVSKANFSKKINDAIFSEGIASLLFMPLKGEHQLLGEFVVYFNEPHKCSKQELNLALVLAENLAAIISHMQDLERTRQGEARYRSIFEQFQDLYYRVDTDGNIVELSPSIKTLLGYDKEEMLGKPVTTVYTNPADREYILQELHKKGKIENYEITLQKKDGEKIVVSVNSHVIFKNNKESVGIEGIVRNITNRKQAEEKLKESETRFRLLAETTSAATLIYQNDYWIYANPAAKTITGYSFDELKQMRFWEIVSPEYVDLIKERGKARQRGEAAPSKYEFKIITKQGKEKWVFLTGNTIELSSGKAGMITAVDITERKQAEEKLKTQKERLNNILEGTNVGTWEWNLQTGEVIVNEKWANLIGYTLNEISPVSIYTCIKFAHHDDLKKGKELIKKHFNGELDYYNFESRAKHKDGSWIWVLDRGKVITRDKDGKPLWMFGTRIDITKQKLNEEKIKHLATHDPLTNLPSLRLVNDRISLAMESTKRKQLLTGVLFVDLDEFKNLNDTYGHNAGDAVLQEVAKRLVSCVRKTDTVGRIGGDEFLLVVTEFQNTDVVESIAKKIINTLSQPMICNGVQLIVTASIGIAIYPTDSDSVEGLIKKSDGAMYVSKKSGKNQFTFANAKKSI